MDDGSFDTDVFPPMYETYDTNVDRYMDARSSVTVLSPNYISLIHLNSAPRHQNRNKNDYISFLVTDRLSIYVSE